MAPRIPVLETDGGDRFVRRLAAFAPVQGTAGENEMGVSAACIHREQFPGGVASPVPMAEGEIGVREALQHADVVRLLCGDGREMSESFVMIAPFGLDGSHEEVGGLALTEAPETYREGPLRFIDQPQMKLGSGQKLAVIGPIGALGVTLFQVR